MIRLFSPFAGAIIVASPAAAQQVRYCEVPPGGQAHDVAVAPDGEVWWTVQRGGDHGILDPRGPDGNAWITDGGQNAIVRVDLATRPGRVWPLPADIGPVDMNTATFDHRGRIWFTGQEAEA